jgi:branched-chain amino acid transport system permease protein
MSISVPALLSQLLVGLMNGSFYAVLSLGLAVIFGMLHIINFLHGAQYMLGAFIAWLALTALGVGYFPVLVLVPVVVGLLGIVIERGLLRHLYALDPLYGLLLTFGIAVMVEGLFLRWYGSIGRTYPIPSQFVGVVNLGFMVLPLYRLWVIVASLTVCLATWFFIEKTKYGSYLRAATERPKLVQAFGVNVPLMLTLTYALGAGLAAFAGVLAAPIYQVSPLMGQNILIVAFAVVVIGGMGSILGAIVTGYLLGIVEGLTKYFYPEASSLAIFVLMTVILLVRPTGLFSRD